ncbi:ROK family protein [Sporosarcina cyprini]|uniref:ROK family protein n=1 Tax=Sporosarcina cyprini TaxID=2910523 RepID=UPI001EDEACFD|nr:ROK family protein [Sporosarcina cyprini]MCG3088327.1 ROK family protein [Sporosarcina cyprini]
MTAIGIDIGGTKMLMLAEYNGERISRTVPTGRDCTPEKIQKEMERFLNDLPFNVDCIGIAVPGLVENENMVVLSDVLPHLAGMDTDFLRFTNKHVYMINDVKAALVREASLDDNPDLVVLMVGTGIAMGMKLNGQFINGCKGWAGELGSMPIPTNEGIRKLDELASGASILARAKADANTVHTQLEEEVETIKEIIHAAGGYLGIGISTIIHLLNPNKIILGGGSLQYKGYYEAALQVAKTNTLPDLWDACSIHKAQEAPYMVAQGAMLFASSKQPM